MAIKIGSRCSDVLTGTSGSDIIIAGKGSDTVYGGEGDDWIYGGKGADELYGGEGNDVLFGGQGTDALFGESGDDTLFGGQGQDVLVGGTGNDVMIGGQGDDEFHMGTGQDVAYGGLGADTFHYSISDNLNSPDIDYISGDSGSDTLVLHMTQSQEAQYRGVIEEALLNHNPAEPFDFGQVTNGTINLKVRSVENLIFEVDGNDAPVATDDSFSVAEDNQLVITPTQLVANDSDPDGSINADSLVVMTAPLHGSLSVNTITGQINYAPNADYNGPDSFTYTVEDNAGATSNVATVNITISAVNDTPTVNDMSFNIAENSANGTIVGQVVATDPEANITNFTITADNSQGAFVIDNNGQITVADGTKLDYETNNQYVLTVQATDAGGLSDTAAVLIDINDVNEPPVVNNAGFAVDENSTNGTVVGQVVATDPDANITNFAITTGNEQDAFAIDANGQITVLDGSKLDYETTNQHPLTVQVTDAGGLSADAAITVNLTNVNESPIVASANFAVAENSDNGTVVGQVVATDPEANITNFTITADNSQGAFVIDNNGQITVADGTKLDYETNNQYVLTVQATDAGGLSDTAAVLIDINDVNEPPVVNNAGFAVDENSTNGTVVGQVVATDPDANITNFAITTGNEQDAFAIDANGQITVLDGSKLDYETTNQHPLTVQVTDAGGLSADAAITVNLTNVNESPIVASANFAVAENSDNGTVVGQVVATDPENNVNSFNITAGNSDGAFVIDNNGQITVADGTKLDYEANNQYVLTVQATDDGGLNATAPIVIDLSDVDESSLSLSIDDITVTEGENAVFTVTLSGDPSAPVTVDYQTVTDTAVGMTFVPPDLEDPGSGSEITDAPVGGGEAPAIADFLHTTGTLTFVPGGSLTQTVTVNTIVDPSSEGTETFEVHLSNPTEGATLDATSSIGVATIIDTTDGGGEDPIGPIDPIDPIITSPELSIDNITVTEGENAVFTVTLSGNSFVPVTVNYQTVTDTAVGMTFVPPDLEDPGSGSEITDAPVGGGEAPAIADFLHTTGTLTFVPGGSLTQTVTVNTIVDPSSEGAETFEVHLSNPTGATLDAASSIGVATIIDTTDDGGGSEDPIIPGDDGGSDIVDVDPSDGGDLPPAPGDDGGIIIDDTVNPIDTIDGGTSGT